MNEQQHQIHLARALDAAGLRWCHVPNGGFRDARTARLLRASGVKAGVPDVLVFSGASGAPRGTALELKSETGSLQAEQREWLAALSAAGWATLVAYGYEDALEQLRTLGYAL